MDGYPSELQARVQYELTAYDQWYRSKASRLARPFYYHHHPSNERAFVRSLLDKFDVPEGARLIDIGCGNGLYADMFAQQGLRVSAVDLSDAAIGYAKQHRNATVDWIAADALTLPFDSEFDYGFCHFFTLFNTANLPEEAVDYGRALMRYIRPGGTLFFVWHSDLTAIRLAGGSRFGINNYTIAQVRAMFPDFRTTSYAVDGMARLTRYLGRFAYHKYVTRLCCAGVYMAASSWHRARIIVAVHRCGK
jgi:SAM-dependent methyltransferase